MRFLTQFDVYYEESAKFNAVWAKFSPSLHIFKTRLKASFLLFYRYLKHTTRNKGEVPVFADYLQL